VRVFRVKIALPQRGYVAMGMFEITNISFPFHFLFGMEGHYAFAFHADMGELETRNGVC
jgi:hypothetical protein